MGGDLGQPKLPTGEHETCFQSFRTGKGCRPQPTLTHVQDALYRNLHTTCLYKSHFAQKFKMFDTFFPSFPSRVLQGQHGPSLQPADHWWTGLGQLTAGPCGSRSAGCMFRSRIPGSGSSCLSVLNKIYDGQVSSLIPYVVAFSLCLLCALMLRSFSFETVHVAYFYFCFLCLCFHI